MKRYFFYSVVFLLCVFFCGAQSKIIHKVGHEKMLNRFLSYVNIESQSIEDNANTFPVTEGQKEIARLIYNEVNGLGGKNVKVTLSDNYYVYIDIASNMKSAPSVLFMAHMDTSPDAPGVGIKPIVHRNYDGGDLNLPSGITLSPNDPGREHLKDLKGKTIVTSDGNTLLGADDKTGCAVLVSMVEELINNPKFKHGRVMVVLSQNEETGLAAMGYDPSVFGEKPDVAIDIDGGNYGSFSIANFTAVVHTYKFKGNNVHPGHAKKGHYGDALTAACYFVGQIPPSIHPSERDGEDGYIHCYDVNSPVDENGKKIKTEYIVKVRLRYFDKNEGDYQKQLLANNLAKTQKAFPNVEISKINDENLYDNIAYALPSFLPKIIEKATLEAGIPLKPEMKRGGTTASLILARFPNDIPGAPGLYSGQQSIHSQYEWACVDELLLLVNACENLITELAGKYK